MSWSHEILLKAARSLAPEDSDDVGDDDDDGGDGDDGVALE